MARPRSAINRRAFIAARVGIHDRVVTPPGTEIASILVQARPERLEDLERTIAAMRDCEIHGRDPRGKLVVIVEAANAGALGRILNTIAALPNVYSASLVFHAVDAG